MNPGSLATESMLLTCWLINQASSFYGRGQTGARDLAPQASLSSAHTLWLQTAPKVIQQAEPKVASSLTHPSFCLPAPQSLLSKPTLASHISILKALSSFLPQPCRLGGIGCLTSEETEAQRCFLILHLLSPSSRVLERWLLFPAFTTVHWVTHGLPLFTYHLETPPWICLSH